MQTLPDLSCWYAKTAVFPEHQRKGWRLAGCSGPESSIIGGWCLYLPYTLESRYWILSVTRIEPTDRAPDLSHAITSFELETANPYTADLYLVAAANPCTQHVLDGMDDRQALSVVDQWALGCVGGSLSPSATPDEWIARMQRELNAQKPGVQQKLKNA